MKVEYGRIITINGEENSPLNIKEYRDAAKITAGNCDAIYLTLGMVGESGEVVDAIKKIVRDVNNGMNFDSSLQSRREKIADELGDFMWYCTVYHDEEIEEKINIAGQPQLDLHAAIAAALDLTMCCTEWAALALDGAPVRTRGTFCTALYNVYDICQALDIDINDVLQKNIKKLNERYSNGFELGVK